jgi:hypothetical protein
MKRRRTKYYNQILDALVTSAKKLNFVIKPTHAMIGFEKATKKWRITTLVAVHKKNNK